MANSVVINMLVKMFKILVKRGFWIIRVFDKSIRGGGKMDNEQIKNRSVRAKWMNVFSDYGIFSHNPEDRFTPF